MLIGHYAAALVAATLPRAPRLGVLFVAAQAVDIALFALALAGVEHVRLVPGFTASNPYDLYDARWTHSLIGTLGWAGLFALGVRLAGQSWRTATIAAAVVAVHWPLDLLVHAPDLTIAGAQPKLGLGLWNHPALAMPLELALAFTALAFYAEHSRARGWGGKLALALLTIAMTAVQLAEWLGPRPATIVDPVSTPHLLRPLAVYAALAALAWWTETTRGVTPRAAPRDRAAT